MSSATILKVGVIGMGQRSSIARHANSEAAGALVAAGVDPDPSGWNRARERFGDGIQLYRSHTELIAAGGIDAAFVTTPDWTHAAIAIDLLRAGIAVYLEKPIATTIVDSDAVLAVAAETGTPLYVGHNFRLSGVVQLMSEIIARGEIGEVKTIWCRHFVGNGPDYYFKDWHADRSKVTSLLLQKASHDIDVIHMLGGGYTKRVVGMGDLMVYGGITDRRERPGETMHDWFSFENWPPLTQTGLNPVVDVEDASMMMMTLDNGVLASYEQCHFTPDYWRNYTVIGTEGRLENFGDTAGGVVKVWNRRHEWQGDGDREYPIGGVTSGHADADETTVTEFLSHLRTGTPTRLSPVAARQAVAAGVLATQSLRSGSVPYTVPDLDSATLSYFAADEARSRMRVS
jgi:predicted dehydrogenase